ncbi:MAG: tetratricopeptide repeat protein [Anaerolineales bacterium]
MKKETSPTNPIITKTKNIIEVAGAAGALTTYLLAIFGYGNTTAPKTLSLITILLTSLFVVGWRWTRLSHKKKSATERKVEKQNLFAGTLNTILAPIQERHRGDFSMPIQWRRVEFSGIFIILTVTTGWTVRNLPAAIAEFQPKSPFRACSFEGARNEDSFLVLVADLKTAKDNPELFISDKIYESLLDERVSSLYEVCSLPKIFDVNTMAAQEAQTLGADVIIWGRSSSTSYEIYLEAPSLSEENRNASNLDLKDAASHEFSDIEPKHITFITQFTLTELLVLKGEFDKARDELERSLVEARQAGVDKKDLASGYFLLALYYDPYFSPDPDIELSILKYSKAIENNQDLFKARLNRGYLYTDLEMIEEAISDYTYLIENGSDDYKGMAYINRSLLQEDADAEMKDLDAAVEAEPNLGYIYRGYAYMERKDFSKAAEDFEQSIIYDPENSDNYKWLGFAQLNNGQYDAARDTFKTMLPYMTAEDRDLYISELDMLVKEKPEVKPAVNDIKAMLLEAAPK